MFLPQAAAAHDLEERRVLDERLDLVLGDAALGDADRSEQFGEERPDEREVRPAYTSQRKSRSERPNLNDCRGHHHRPRGVRNWAGIELAHLVTKSSRRT